MATRSACALALVLVATRPACALALVLASSAVSCSERICNAMGCVDDDVLSLTLTLSPGFPRGTYDISLVTEQGTRAVTCQLAADLGCDSLSNDVETEVRIDGGAVDIALSVFGRPRLLTVEVSRDGAAVASQTLKTAYGTFYPNGPGCGDYSCRTAKVEPDTIWIYRP